MNILFYPVFSNREHLTDHFYRLHWYLYPFKDHIDEITLLHTLNDNPIGELPSYFDKNLLQLTKQFPKVRLVKIKNISDAEEIAKNADFIFLWSTDPSQASKLPDTELKPAIRNKKIIRVDHSRERFAGSFYLKFAEFFPDEIDNCVTSSRRVFKKITERCSSQKGYIFGTGPGLASVKEYDFSDGISIACNSMVRNGELLDRLQPPLIVIGDPIFHAGPSRYAAAFRKELIEALDRYDAFLIVPLRDYHIYKVYLPKRIHKRMAAMPYKNGKMPNLDLTKNYFVTSTANILTLFLLPLASTFFKEIVIAGCDGRPLEDDGYFWKHDKASQFNDEMQSIRDTHPAFFSLDYNEYYLEHCETLKKWLDVIERRPKKISNITPSFIPALRERFNNPLSKTDNIAEVIILDPDALDNFGHYLPFDERLKEACEVKGIAFSIFGNIKCSSEIIDTRPYFEPVFSLHSWTIGNRPKGPAKNDLAKFETELRRTLKLREEKGLTHKTVLYMYCGSLPVVKIVNDVLKEFDNISAVICLFWLSFLDYKASSCVAEWKTSLQECVQEQKVTITVPTKRLAMGVKDAFGIELSVAPHASTTFSDSDTKELFLKHVSKWTSPRNQKLNILFPGGLRQEKGFEITANSVLRVTSEYQDKFNCIVRAIILAKTSPSMIRLVDKLNECSATISNNQMDDAEFPEFLAQADIIVLPYQAPDFSERTSGLLIDALYLGIPVIVWENTWLADIVVKYKNGVIVKGKSTDAFIAALLKIADKYKKYSSVARKAQTSYFQSNSWSQLVDSITVCAIKQNINELSSKQVNPMHPNITPSFVRNKQATLDETDIIAELYKNTLTGSLMIDVGAHHGSAFSPFMRMGWDIFAFEPDPKNRDYLVKYHGEAKNVIISPQAVGENANNDVSFYASDESSGISGMLKFRDSHKQVTTVEVTTIAETIKEHDIDHIDFLKIDVEGYDFGVLKGVPWDKIKPDVIECEFEDAKTNLLGHTWRNICDYLVERGYTVYVSEWHPIIRYGIAHDWHAMKKYPCKLADENAWGNLLAFKNDPGDVAIAAAIKKNIKFRNSEAGVGVKVVQKKTIPSVEKKVTTSDSKPDKKTEVTNKMKLKEPAPPPQTPARQIGTTERPLYANISDRLRLKAPALFRIGQAGIWGLRFIKRHLILSILGLSIFAVLALGPIFSESLKSYSVYSWGLAGLLIFIVVVIIGASYANLMSNRIAEREHLVREQVKQELLALLKETSSKQEVELKQALSQIETLKNASKDTNAQVSSVANRETSAREQVKQELLALVKETSSKQTIKLNILQQKSDERLEQSLEAMNETKALKNMIAEIRKQLDKEINRNSTSFMLAQEQLEGRLDSKIQSVEKSIKTSEQALKKNADILHSMENETISKQGVMQKEIIKSEEKINDLKGTLADAGENLNKLIIENDKTQNLLGEYQISLTEAKNNVAKFQQFNREFTRKHIELLKTNWLKHLHSAETPRSLAYMAERINLIETNLKGRLATTIEAAVLRTLVALAVQGKTLHVLEIGTLFGTGIAMIHDRARHNYENIHFTVIDPLEGYYGNDRPDILTGEKVNEAVFFENLSTANIPLEDFTLIKGFSTDDDVILAASKNKYDVLIIDGDHSYAGVKADFVNYAPLVKRSGYIIVDDYGTDHWPEIQKYVDAELLPRDDISLIGSSWRTAVFRVIKKVKT